MISAPGPIAAGSGLPSMATSVQSSSGPDTAVGVEQADEITAAKIAATSPRTVTTPCAVFASSMMSTVVQGRSLAVPQL